MLKRFVLIIALAILGVALTGTAQAGSAIKTSFSMEPNSSKIQLGETVTFTDHTINTCGCELHHYWYVYTQHYGPATTIEVGNPACVNPDCTQIRVTPTTAGLYKVDETASGFGDITEIESHSVTFRVFDPSLPPIFTINGPMTIGLPAVVEVLSQMKKVSVAGCAMPGPGKSEVCQPYLLSQTGPDSQGRYHFQFRIPVGHPGPMEITFNSSIETPNGNAETFTFNISSSKEHFGDVRSCYRGGSYLLSYYDTTSSKALVKLQVLRGKRWVTLQSKSANRIVPSLEFAWMQRRVEVSFGSAKTSGSKRRVVYEIRKGHKLLKQGRLLKQRCQE